MRDAKIRILLIEDAPGDADFLQEVIRNIKEQSFQLTWVDRLNRGLEQLTQNEFDVILLDLNLPESTGLLTLRRVHENAGRIPIVILTGLDDNQTALEAIKRGAQDYLPKDKISEDILLRVIRYAIERNRLRIDSQENEEKFVSLFNYSNDGIILHDRSGKVLDVNQRALKILGYEKSEMIGLKIMDLHPEYSITDYRSKTKQILTKGYALFERDFKHKAGRIINAEVSASAFQLGNEQFILKIIRDITERKRAEQKLLLQDSALKSAANGIVITDKDGTILWVNKSFTRLTGYEFDEAVGQNPRILKSKKQDRGFYKTLWTTILSGKVWQGELINSKKDGSDYVEEQTITPVKNDKGEITHFISIKIDITNRKLAEDTLKANEARFRSVAESANDGLIMANSDGNIIFCNTSLEKMFGFKRSEIINKSITTLMPDKFQAAHRTGMNRFLKTEKPKMVGQTIELVGRKKGGEEFPIELSLSSWKSEGRIFFTGIIRDISVRRKTELELRERERYLKALNAASQMLLSTTDVPSYQEFVEIIGPVSRASRAYIFLNHLEGDILFASQVAEWCTEDIDPQIANPELQNVPYSVMPRWEKFLARGKMISGKTKDLPKNERGFLGSQGVKAVLVLPLLVGNDFVGFIGFDNCHSDRPWEPVERDFLQAASSDLAEAMKRNSVEVNLKESEDRFRTAFEEGPMGIGLITPDTKYIRANKALCRMLGYSEVELKQLTFLDITHSDDLERDRNAAEKIFSGKFEFFKTEKRYTRKDKQLLWANVSVSVIKGSDGKVNYAVVMVEDITKRKEAEQNLKTSEEKFRQLFEDLPDAIFVTRMGGKNSGKILDVNPAAEMQTGYGRDELLGMNILRDLTTETFDKANVSEAERKLLANKTLRLVEKKRRKDGSEYWTEVQLTTIKYAGEEACLSVNRDVTEQKQQQQALAESEELLSHARDAAGLGLYDWNLSGDLLSRCSKSYYEISGLMQNQKPQTIEEMLKRIHPDDRQRVQDEVAKALESRDSFDEEYRIIWPDGIIKWISDKGKIFRNSHGKPLRVIGAIADITARKHAEEQIRWLARFPAENSAPVLRISRDGVVLYANKSGAPILQEWQCEVNQSLPDVWHEFVTEAFESGETRVIEISAGSTLYSLTFAPIAEANYVNIYGVNITDLKKTDALLRKRTHDLGERVKEMTCLYTSYHLLDNPSLTLDQKLQRIVDIMPPGWQYPQITCARIQYKNKEYRTDNFHKSKWRQFADIAVSGKKHGVIEVCYLEEKPEMDIGPFLKEEKDLIETIAKNIEEHIEHETAVDELRNSEERLKILFESVPDAIYLNDFKGNFVDANKAAEELTGYKKKDLIGKNMLESRLLSAPQVPKAAKLLANSALNKPTGPDEFTLTRKGGTPVVVEIRTFPVRIQDRKLVLGIARDITERRKAEEALRNSEEKYRTIFEETKDAIYISSVGGEIIDMNPAGIRLFGYDSLKELMSVNTKDDIYCNPLDRKKFHEVLEQKGFVIDYETDLKKKNGEKLIVLNSANVIRDENGVIMGYRGIMRDITAEKELTRQLLQVQKMEAIGTLAGGIAHDFNNILGAILGYSELTTNILNHGDYNPTIKGNLEQVYKAGLRAKDLVQQILTFSRQAKYQMKPLRLELVVNEVVKLLRASIPVSIEIVRNIDKKCGFINADLTQMHQVLMNLGTNAYHAMREKATGTLGFALKPVKINGKRPEDNPSIPPGNYLKLTVSDTGHGIPPETLPRIFDPFFTTKGSGFGTGLGLSVVHGIIKEHNGAITVISKPGEGSTFNVYLPIIEQSLTYEGDSDLQIPRGAESILLVDDEKVLVTTGKQILQNLGYKVTGVPSGPEALEIFQKDPGKFDLVITDLAMPKMRGIELAKKMLEIQPEIPIILVTGYSETLTRDSVKEMGLFDLVIKPVLTKDFGMMVRRALDSKVSAKI